MKYSWINIKSFFFSAIKILLKPIMYCTVIYIIFYSTTDKVYTWSDDIIEVVAMCIRVKRKIIEQSLWLDM